MGGNCHAQNFLVHTFLLNQSQHIALDLQVLIRMSQSDNEGGREKTTVELLLLQTQNTACMLPLGPDTACMLPLGPDRRLS